LAYKFCPSCRSASYSQSEHRIWLCPVCGKDISFMPTTKEPVIIETDMRRLELLATKKRI